MSNIKFLLIILVFGLLLTGCDYINQFREDPSAGIIEEEPLITIVPEEEILIEPPEEFIEEVIEEQEIEGVIEVIEEELEVVEEESKITGNVIRLEVTEGEEVKIKTSAQDPDGDPLFYRFDDPLNDKGEWQTQEGDAGSYESKITVSDGRASSSQDILIVVKPLNLPPELGPIKDIEVDEGETITLTPIAIDPEGEDITFTYSGWMNSDEYKTTYKDAGTHTVTITASDGVKSSSIDVKITVNNVNRAPELEVVKGLTIDEGQKVKLTATASDPDDDELTTTFSSPLNDEGEWQTQEGDAGEYDVIVTASDGSLETKETVKITVNSLNKAPVIENFDDLTVDESETITLSPDVSDPEGNEVTVKYSGWMTTNTYTTTHSDAGSYDITLTASDGEMTTTKTITITVNDVNRPPEIGDITLG